MRGAGSAVFVAILLLIAGILNIIYGIAAIGNANFFDGTQYAFSTLNTWGWITVVLGVIQLTAGFSLLGGGTYGRVIGIVAATIGAVGSLPRPPLAEGRRRHSNSRGGPAGNRRLIRPARRPSSHRVRS